MCGLSGAAGTLDHKAEAAFKDLLFLNTLRGSDSTGAASIGRALSDIPKVAKCIGPAWLLQDMGRFRKDVMGGQNKVYLGHNRAATRGGITLGNAHPFVFDNIFGAHNGTVWDHYLKDLPDRAYFVTDSEIIIHAIDKIGIEATIKQLRGAWALTWFDKRDNSINLLRNPERPLYFAFDKDHKALFWSSELHFLSYALDKHGIDRETRKDGSAKAFYPPDNVWYKWKIPEFNKAFGNVETKTLECAAIPEVTHTNTNFTKKGQNISGLTDWYDQTGKTGTGNGTRYYGVDAHGVYREGSGTEIVDAAVASYRQERGPMHEKLMEKRKGPAFPLIYRSGNSKIHYDLDTEQFHRYYFSPTEYDWHHTIHNLAPAEIADKDLKNLLAAPLLTGDDNKDKPETDPNVSPKDFIRYKSKYLWVVKRPMSAKDSKPWIAYRWNKVRGGWDSHTDSSPPIEMPFTLLDVDASHCFHTEKKKKNRPREQFYKGWNGKLLTRDTFNEICQEGCCGCGRIPRWLEGKMGGVRVHFINATDFVCQFCGEDGETVKGLISNPEPINDAPLNDPLPTIN